MLLPLDILKIPFVQLPKKKIVMPTIKYTAQKMFPSNVCSKNVLSLNIVGCAGDASRNSCRF
jgi:hypothetical protein